MTDFCAKKTAKAVKLRHIISLSRMTIFYRRTSLIIFLLSLLLHVVFCHPMLDAITRWTQKAAKTKLGKGIFDSFFSGGQLKSDETTEDTMEFEKQRWLEETGQVKVRRFVLNQRERGDYILKFREYYECLKNRRTNKDTMKARAVVLRAGASTTFECRACQYPNRGDQSLWRRLLFSETASEDVPVDMDHFIVTPSLNLTIQGAVSSDAGIYMCMNFYTIHSVYNVDVVGIVRPKAVHGPNAPKGPYAVKDQELPGNNLMLYTEWSAWSSCSRCDRVGRRFRSGMCYVKPLTPGDPIRLRPNVVNKVAMSAFERFPGGLPCKTRLLPDELRELKQVKVRRPEREVRYCKVPCPRTRIWLVRDAYGNVRELWKKNNRSEAEVLQSQPVLSTYVRRSTVYTQTGKKIRIVCTGADRSQVIQWQRGGQLLDPVQYRRFTKGRVFIDINKVMHIRKAALSDTALYTCWQRDSMVASVNLVVEYNIYFKYKEYIVVIGISGLALGIAVALIYMCVKACYKRCGGGKPKPKMLIGKT